MISERKALPVGVDNFAQIIRHNGYYADKTHLVGKLLTNIFPGGTVLFTRPRRFGKSLALSMLRHFFDCNAKEENRPLFDGLAVAQSERYMSEQGKYPVIFLNLKDVKGNTQEQTLNTLRLKLRNAILPFSYLVRSDKLEPSERDSFAPLIMPNVALNDLATQLEFVCSLLAKHHGQPVVILIDEYDTPLQSAYMHGFYQPMCDVMRNLFSSALKSNDSLRLGVITGVMRIAKESLFSGLNNLEVDTILNKEYADCFGFTPAEMDAMIQDYGVTDKIEEIREWYDGYRFGDQDIYNPWSVLRYFKAGCEPQAYWLDTSSNNLAKDFLRRLQEKERDALEELYNDGCVEANVDTTVAYPQLESCEPEVLFSLLAVSGYLKPVQRILGSRYLLKIPNHEIRTIYTHDILSYVERNIGMRDLRSLSSAIVQGQTTRFAQILRQYMIASLSYYDNLEAFYHGWMMGLLVCMSDSYTCKSNREAGFGRSDITLTPNRGCQGPGLVFELKHCAKPEQLAEAAEEALRQMEDRQYVAELSAEVGEVLGYGISFCGKECEIAQRVLLR